MDSRPSLRWGRPYEGMMEREDYGKGGLRYMLIDP